MHPHDWHDSFPFASPRPQQVAAIEHALETFDLGRKFELLEMGVGCGKSAVAATLAHFAARNSITTAQIKSGGYILTPQKILQDQYVNDFNQHIKSIKSAASYSCSQLAANCSESSKLQKLMGDKICGASCLYKIAKKDFLDSDISLTNYAFFLHDALYVKDIVKKPFMAIDECHTLETALCAMCELQFSSQSIRKILNISVPNLSSVDEIVTWLNDTCAKAIKTEIEKITKLLSCASRESLESSVIQLEAKRLEKLVNLISKIKRIAESIDDTWATSVSYDEHGEISVSIKPTDIADSAEQMLFKYAANVLLMSATICDSSVLCDALGIDHKSARFVSFESPFDPAQRPIHYTPIGKMSASQIDKSIPNLIEAVKIILREHSMHKGIVHTGNYKISKILQESISSSRCIFHDDSNRDAALATHLSTQRPTVLFSPSMIEGVDLRDDLSRFQIICKIPFPHFQDAWVRKRAERNPKWYSWITASKIAQAVGRSVRNETDWAETYILDSCWERFFADNRSMFNKSFISALQ